jgi:glycosyltransferase involved in cell wall biosynthesis
MTKPKDQAMSNSAVIELAAPGTQSRKAEDLEIAVLIPCYNEELTIAQVVNDFRHELPHASIYVFDNNSADNTAEIARQAGAIVVSEPRQGKGFVVQSMFRHLEADLYIMVDGDGTYPAAAVRDLIQPVLKNSADMVVGSRLLPGTSSRFKYLNLLGNHLFLATLNAVFGVRLSDILSGYRVFSRTFVKGIALVGGGFEVETELTIKALEGGFRIVEVPVDLGERPLGSFSKIHKLRDGMRILSTIFALLRDYKPLTFFSLLSCASFGGGCVPGSIVIWEYMRTGLVLRMPSAVLAVGMVLMAGLSLTVGVILHSMTRRIREVEYLIRCGTNHDAKRPAAERRRAA